MTRLDRLLTLWPVLIAGAVTVSACGSGSSSPSSTQTSATTATTPTTTTPTPTPPAPTPTVTAVSVVPAAGNGAGRTFTFTYSDPDGAASIATTEALFASGTSTTGVNGCHLLANSTQFWLRNDDESAWSNPVTAGSADTASNSQCTLTAAASAITSAGDRVTTTVTLTFNPSFAGAKAVYLKATDRNSIPSPWTQKGTWTVGASNPRQDVVLSSCADASRDAALSVELSTEQEGRVSVFGVTPACFPAYGNYLPQEGYFKIGDRRPLPILGRTCGHFDILAVFIDTAANRQSLQANASLSASVKAKIADDKVPEALSELFASYTSAQVMSGFSRPQAAQAVDFTFATATTSQPSTVLDLDDAGLGFPQYDAVVIIDALGAISAHGVERWPAGLTRPLFLGRDGGFILHLAPQALSPALFGHELLHRNVPILLTEYQFGPPTFVRVGSTTYDQTPIINPRTGENIEPLIRAYEGKTPMVEYLAGLADVDGDGVTDCVAPAIKPTSTNIDGDFIPDRLDPDLGFDHRPYNWLYAIKGGVTSAAQLLLPWFRR